MSLSGAALREVEHRFSVLAKLVGRLACFLSASLAALGCTGSVSVTGGGGGGTASACSDGLVVCAGSCVDTQADPEHCGACGYGCGAEQICLAGKCEAPCPPGSAPCGGACTDVLSDAANCGGCGDGCLTEQ